MTDNFKEIGSLFGREGAGAGFAKQTELHPLLRPVLLGLGKSSSGHPSHLPQSEPDLPSHRL